MKVVCFCFEIKGGIYGKINFNCDWWFCSCWEKYSGKDYSRNFIIYLCWYRSDVLCFNVLSVEKLGRFVKWRRVIVFI